MAITRNDMNTAEAALIDAYRRFNEAMLAKQEADKEVREARECLSESIKAMPHIRETLGI